MLQWACTHPGLREGVPPPGHAWGFAIHEASAVGTAVPTIHPQPSRSQDPGSLTGNPRPPQGMAPDDTHCYQYPRTAPLGRGGATARAALPPLDPAARVPGLSPTIGGEPHPRSAHAGAEVPHTVWAIGLPFEPEGYPDQQSRP